MSPLLILAGAALAAHPPITLRDHDGANVFESGGALDTSQTCGMCHDRAYLLTHSFHALLDPANPDSPGRAVATECFGCHLTDPDMAARQRALDAGQPQWTGAAMLSGLDLLTEADGAWSWAGTQDEDANEDAETDDDVADDAEEAEEAAPVPVNIALPIVAASSEGCGNCHVTVHDGREPLEMTAEDYRKSEHGEVFAWQRISRSGVNIEGRDQLGRPWDLHFERLLGCSDCHKGPDVMATGEAAPPHAHMAFGGPALDTNQLLVDLAAGTAKDLPSAAELTSGVHSDCQSCHDTETLHQQMPRRQAHLDALACESCHIPTLYAPGRRVEDRSMLTVDGQSRAEWRGVEGQPGPAGQLITGWHPTLLPDADGKLAPYSLKLSTWWASGGEEIPPAALRQALLVPGGYHPDVVKALDGDGDGALSDDELALDTPAKVQAIQARLAAAGHANAVLVGEVTALGIHHGVGGEHWTTATCEGCHGAAGSVLRTTSLTNHLAAGLKPTLAMDSDAPLDGTLVVQQGKRLEYRPDTQGRIVPGSVEPRLLDLVGWLAMIATFAGLVLLGLRRGREEA